MLIANLAGLLLIAPDHLVVLALQAEEAELDNTDRVITVENGTCTRM